MAGPSWMSLSPLSSISFNVPVWTPVGRACAAGAKQMSELRMNSALRGRREIAGIASISWRPTQAAHGSVSKRNQLVLRFWMKKKKVAKIFVKIFGYMDHNIFGHGPKFTQKDFFCMIVKGSTSLWNREIKLLFSLLGTSSWPMHPSLTSTAVPKTHIKRIVWGAFAKGMCDLCSCDKAFVF